MIIVSIFFRLFWGVVTIFSFRHVDSFTIICWDWPPLRQGREEGGGRREEEGRGGGGGDGGGADGVRRLPVAWNRAENMCFPRGCIIAAFMGEGKWVIRNSNGFPLCSIAFCRLWAPRGSQRRTFHNSRARSWGRGNG